MRKYLKLVWSVSKGRETAGWNICTLIDGPYRYRTKGGGYDMIGTVFGEWLWKNYRDEIIEFMRGFENEEDTRIAGYYGFYWKGENMWIDGACGLDSMKKIARAIGIEVTQDCFGHIRGFWVSRAATVNEEKEKIA